MKKKTTSSLCSIEKKEVRPIFTDVNMSQTYLHILAKMTGEPQEGHRMGESDEEIGLRLQGGWLVKTQLAKQIQP